MESPTAEHLAALKKILRYLAGTLDYGCFYARMKDQPRLSGSSDSDMAGDLDTRKSTTGIIFFLGSSPISWQSQKQKVVALSTCEAEYIAATTAACQGLWLARLIGELDNTKADPFELKLDNKAAIALSKNPVFHDRSKHIDTKYHFIRECVENGSVHVDFINTQNQLADILTKALGRAKFQELRARIEMIQLKNQCRI